MPQNIARIGLKKKKKKKILAKKLLVCPQKFILQDFLWFFVYNEDKSISFYIIFVSSCNFFRNQARTIKKYGKIHTHLIHIDERK